MYRVCKHTGAHAHTHTQDDDTDDLLERAILRRTRIRSHERFRLHQQINIGRKGESLLTMHMCIIKVLHSYRTIHCAEKGAVKMTAEIEGFMPIPAYLKCRSDYITRKGEKI